MAVAPPWKGELQCKRAGKAPASLPTSPRSHIARAPPPFHSCRLRQQLQWRYACSPEDNSCCLPLPSASFLAAQLGMRGLTPLTEASCTYLPGYLSQSNCWPNWGAGSCHTYTSSSACLENEQCQVHVQQVGWR